MLAVVNFPSARRCTPADRECFLPAVPLLCPLPRPEKHCPNLLRAQQRERAIPPPPEARGFLAHLL
jgi:hypothetical protein